MFRAAALSVPLLLASCSGSGDAPKGTATATPAAVATPAPPTAEALAAQRVVQDYFDRLHVGDTAAAFALWSRDSSVATGGAKQFAAAMPAAGRFAGQAGEPTAIKETDGMRFVLVEAAARVTSLKRPPLQEYGVMMLKRPAAADGAWRIWGQDLRPRHCPKGQTPRGLGCITS